jgi:hypothetical protein
MRGSRTPASGDQSDVASLSRPLAALGPAGVSRVRDVTTVERPRGPRQLDVPAGTRQTGGKCIVAFIGSLPMPERTDPWANGTMWLSTRSSSQVRSQSRSSGANAGKLVSGDSARDAPLPSACEHRVRAMRRPSQGLSRRSDLRACREYGTSHRSSDHGLLASSMSQLGRTRPEAGASSRSLAPSPDRPEPVPTSQSPGTRPRGSPRLASGSSPCAPGDRARRAAAGHRPSGSGCRMVPLLSSPAGLCEWQCGDQCI